MMSNSIKTGKAKITLVAAYALLLLSLPAVANFAHNHEFDGHTHNDCPVHLFSAAFQGEQVTVPICDCLITPLYFLERQETNSHKLADYYYSLAQRAPPA